MSGKGIGNAYPATVSGGSTTQTEVKTRQKRMLASANSIVKKGIAWAKIPRVHATALAITTGADR